MTGVSARTLLAGVAVMAMSGCVGPQEYVHYRCSHGARLNVSFQTNAHTVTINDMVGQQHVLREVSSDGTQTVYQDVAVRFVRDGNTAEYSSLQGVRRDLSCIADSPVTSATPAWGAPLRAGTPG